MDLILVSNHIFYDDNQLIDKGKDSGSKNYYGQIGFIYADEPKDIQQLYWDEYIKKNIGSKFIFYYGENRNSSYFLEGDMLPKQWWIFMSNDISKKVINQYHWEIYEELTSEYHTYDDTVYVGEVLLDGEIYHYSAIQPTVQNKIKYSK